VIDRKLSWPAYPQNIAYSIPDLQFNGLIVMLNNPRTKFHAYCHFVLFAVPTRSKLQENARLADPYITDYLTRIANDYELEQEAIRHPIIMHQLNIESKRER